MYRQGTVSGSAEWVNGRRQSDALAPTSPCLSPQSRSADGTLTRASPRMSTVMGDPHSHEEVIRSLFPLWHIPHSDLVFSRTFHDCSGTNLCSEGTAGFAKGRMSEEGTRSKSPKVAAGRKTKRQLDLRPSDGVAAASAATLSFPRGPEKKTAVIPCTALQ